MDIENEVNERYTADTTKRRPTKKRVTRKSRRTKSRRTKSRRTKSRRTKSRRTKSRRSDRNTRKHKRIKSTKPSKQEGGLGLGRAIGSLFRRTRLPAVRAPQTQQRKLQEKAGKAKDAYDVASKVTPPTIQSSGQGFDYAATEINKAHGA